MKIFCDFDGTLSDVTKRHYRVYSEVVCKHGGEPMQPSMYWNLKRQKTGWPELLDMSGLPITLQDEFLDDFRSLIEAPEYLKEDTLYPGALEMIHGLAHNHDLILVSLRRKPENLKEQITWLGLTPYFSKVLTAHSESDGYDKKIELIKQELSPGVESVIIGDTEADIVTGKQLGITTVAVISGIRDKAFLAQLNPDYCISDISQLDTVLGV